MEYVRLCNLSRLKYNYVKAVQVLPVTIRPFKPFIIFYDDILDFSRQICCTFITIDKLKYPPKLSAFQ